MASDQSTATPKAGPSTLNMVLRIGAYRPRDRELTEPKLVLYFSVLHGKAPGAGQMTFSLAFCETSKSFFGIGGLSVELFSLLPNENIGGKGFP